MTEEEKNLDATDAAAHSMDAAHSRASDETQNKCEEYKQGWQRAVADYQNLEREMKENKKIWHDTAVMRTVLEVLPVYDNMKKALAHTPADGANGDVVGSASSAWVEGCKMIVKQFEDVLKRMGTEEIKALGEKFDPYFHDAMAEEESTEPEHTIIKVLETGYKIGEMVIRPAKVVLAKNSQNKNNNQN